MSVNILVVDDHPGIRLLLLEIFTHEGYNVAGASNGKEALEKLVGGSFHLVVLDQNLPLLTGLEVIEAIGSKQIPVKVVLMSGVTELLAEKTKKHDFVLSIIEKPFNINDLCDIVKSITI